MEGNEAEPSCWALPDKEAALALLSNVDRLSSAYLDRLHAPLLMAMPPEWQLAQHKLLVVGQETNGWGFFGSQSPVGEYLKGHRQEADPVLALVRSYIDFDFANETPAERSPFWQAQREFCRQLESGDRRRVLWTNLARCSVEPLPGQKGCSAWWNSSYQEVDQLCEWQSELLRSEITGCQARSVVFFTGPQYDYILKKTFRELEFVALREDIPERQLAKLVHASLPKNAYRTYHPAYLRRSGRWHWLDYINKEISPEISDLGIPTAE